MVERPAWQALEDERDQDMGALLNRIGGAVAGRHVPTQTAPVRHITLQGCLGRKKDEPRLDVSTLM